jgi:hypothetical protein
VAGNGIMAAVLLQFNRSRWATLETLVNGTKLEGPQVESLLALLESKKAGKLLVREVNRYFVNPEFCNNPTPIWVQFDFPLSVPVAEDSARPTLLQGRDHQVDCAAMQVMKGERSMAKSDLKARVRDILQFRLEEDLFEARLAHLAHNLYVRLDPAGVVHYLP